MGESKQRREVMSWGTYIKSAVIGWFVTDIAPIILATVRAVVLVLADRDMTGKEKKKAAMSAIETALKIQCVEVTVKDIDEAIEKAVVELKV